jgi:tetratricopeptide (TPR) repeat protein
MYRYRQKELHRLGAALLLCVLTATPFASRAADEAPLPAIASFEEAEAIIRDRTQRIAADPTATTFYLERGNAYFQTGAFDEAIRDFTKAIELDPALDAAWFGRGMARGRGGEIDAGIEDLSVYIDRHPASSLAYTKRGIRRLWSGDRDGAEADLSKALELDPGNAEAHDDIGVILAQREQYNDAIAHFTTTIKLDPSYQKAYHNLAMAYFIVNQDALALQFVDKALRLSPDNRNSMLLKAEILRATGRIEEARQLKEDAEFLPEGNWSERISVQ